MLSLIFLLSISFFVSERVALSAANIRLILYRFSLGYGYLIWD